MTTHDFQKNEDNFEKTPHTLRDTSSPTSKYGPLIAVILIVIILVAGSVYFFHKRLNEQSQQKQHSDQLMQQEIENIRTQSSSTSFEAIEKDLQETNIENSDHEMQQIEQEYDM